MIKIGITQGDINGIGYQVILKAFEDPRMAEMCTPILYGSVHILRFYEKLLQLPHVQYNVIADATQARPEVLNVIEVTPNTVNAEPGKDSPEAGAQARASLERAVADARAGLIDAIVTAPINKHNIQSPDFTFPGHTEYLEAVAGNGAKSLMILCNDTVRVALVTTHLPIASVAGAITTSNIVKKIITLNDSLISDFGIHHPRIAVLALNPHAGDNGLLGDEEQNIIIPALEEVRSRRIQAYGPYAADGFFGSGNFKRFDGILAMYHDQGLAPFKTLAMADGLNFTAGLPIVRTSPDHGTGYDIADTPAADASSMRSAIYAAIDIVRSRRRHAEATANPLPKQTTERKDKKEN